MMQSNKERPIIQVSLRDFASRKQEIAKDLWKAATEIGFFYLCDTGISDEEVQQMFNMSKAFFGLPSEKKGSYGFDLDKNIGWESGRQKRPSHPIPELKESLQLKWHGMEGMWPSDKLVPNFEATSKAFMEKCQQVSYQVLSCFAIGLGFEEDFFTKNHDVGRSDAQQTFRLMHYFSVEGKEFPPGFPRAGSHCDFETITLLFAKGAGLEVCPGREAISDYAQGSEWTPCPAIPGTITELGKDLPPIPSEYSPDTAELVVVNIGDALMRWSGDRLKSNFHRVRMPTPSEDQSSRYSIAYFNQANKPAIIESTDGKYPPISAEDFVRESLRAIYVKSEA